MGSFGVFTLYTKVILIILKTLHGAEAQALACKSEEYQMRHGTITSPNYPAPYPSNFCKDWFITGDTGDIVTISFKMYDIEPGVDGSCDRDFLQFIPDKSTVRICGTMKNIPRVYISKTKHVRIHFFTDYTTSRSGFELMYIMGPLNSPKCETDEFRCGNGKCIFQEWRCNGAAECEDHSDEDLCDVVSKSVAHPSTPTVNVRCSTDSILCQTLVGNQHQCVSKLKFCDGVKDCLNGEDEEKKLCDSHKCNTHIDGKTGYVTSPNFPLDYPENIDCYMTIHVQDSAAQVQLRFVSFNLPNEPMTDYLMIYDGTYRDGKIIGTYYGQANNVPQLVESSTDYVTLKFHSDGSRSESGFNITYQKKGVCLSDQLHCGAKENDCYAKSKKCDGVWDCRNHGGDEKGCGRCSKDQFSCGLKGNHQCYEEKQRCNGMSHCAELNDELNCNSVLCGPHNGTFLCDNKRCIYETWKCDKTNDCGDNSDEVDCPRSTTLITIAAVSGSLICALLLVVAMGCTCKLYNLRMQQFHGPRHETPLTRFYAEFMRRRAPPPYHEAMLTSRPYDEVRQELAQEHANENETATSRTRRHRRRRHPRRSDNSNTQTGDQNDQCQEVPTNTSQSYENAASGQSSQSTNSSNLTQNTDQHSSRALLIPDDSSDTTEGADVSGDDSDHNTGEHVRFSHNIGITARWHRPRNTRKEDSESESLLQPPDSPPSAGRGSVDVTTTSCDSVEPLSVGSNNTNVCDDNNSEKSCDTDLLGASSSSVQREEGNLISFDNGSDETQQETSDSSNDTDNGRENSSDV